MATYFYTPRYHLIYVMRIPLESHRGIVKIGDTSVSIPDWHIAPNSPVLNEAARKRIKEYTQTAGIGFELLHTELAVYLDPEGLKGFDDHAVHRVLERSGVRKKCFNQEINADEWFECDLDTARRAIEAVKQGRSALHASEVAQGDGPIRFRPEQEEAIRLTLKQFRKGRQMLWNAKMRFGKTLCALEVVKRRGDLRRVLILTHRPVVDAGWFEDFGKVFYDTPGVAYGSRQNGETFEALEARARRGECRYVYFASMQDLRGSEQVGGKFDKNHGVFSTPWDMVIVDEAHEGTQTELGRAVMKELTKDAPKLLQLSGTPFNLLSDYSEEEIYTWDYVMEQRAKVQWGIDHPGDPNPYACLPRLNIYTYDLGRLLHEYIDGDVAFNFREFFRTRPADGRFVHEADIARFLDLLTLTDEESMYPFANRRYRDIFRHTLWMLPGVKAAKALAAMLREHPVFGLFEVVNVAGEGDEEQPGAQALAKVTGAIGPDPDMTRTITLSCGRLTTGVSVKPWMGILMLTGSVNTAAAQYMQTIFRVQTPATINGRVKEDCYVFDFAPDRTLKVLAETAKISSRPGEISSDRLLGEFLNFCPVIAVQGSQMERLDTEQMLQQLKRVYVDRVVRNGFEDEYLYNDNLMRLSALDIKAFAELKGIIGQTKAIGRAADITVNDQGLTREEYAEASRLGKKPRKQLTAQELARLEELKRKRQVKHDAISILRGISIRMPLLIYGAQIGNEDRELTIDNFTRIVDKQSWAEFMPRGVTKARFNAFRKYYDPDIFTAAAKRIRAMARAADLLPIEERIGRIAGIFATFRNPDKETVLTPWRVVNMHLGSTLGGYSFYNEDWSEPLEEPRFIDCGAVTAEAFAPGAQLLEINSKTGLYPLYLAYNAYRARLREATVSPHTLEEHLSVWDKAVAESVFVVCKTLMAKRITRRTLMGFRPGKTNMWAPEDLIDKIKNRPEQFVEQATKPQTWTITTASKMKFKAVVGNPPYQEINEGLGNGANPLYHLFIGLGRQLSPLGTMIHPARFLFNAGKTPKDWNDKILHDPHFKVVDYWVKSVDVFNNVDVKGGIAITMWDETQECGPIGFFSPYPEVRSILEKVSSTKPNSFADIVYPRDLYKLSETLYYDYPQFEGRQSQGHRLDIGSSIFEIFPELFFDEKPSDEYIGLYGLDGRERKTKWIKRKYVKVPDNIDRYKILVPKSNGTGAIGEVLSTPVIGVPVIGVPVIGHTLTFLSIGGFSEAPHAEACLKYVKSRFARLLLGTLKVTQDNPKDTWANVPLQDFTAGSDIDWSQPVAGIDAQLYAKYGLTHQEIAFIERMIKPME